LDKKVVLRGWRGDGEKREESEKLEESIGLSNAKYLLLYLSY